VQAAAQQRAADCTEPALRAELPVWHDRCPKVAYAMLRRTALTIATLLVATREASAEPRSLTYRYSPYEEQAIHDAESALGTTVDPTPEGKTIERVDLVRLDPIDPHDPLPVAINTVHATSRPEVLRHELLVKEGDAWRSVLVDESARNLRALPQVSLVLCVAMQASTPDRVRLVVVTKDVWSLYVDFDVAGTPGGLELLDLEPKETNIAGLQHTALARFILQPKTYTLGASYEVPRLSGRWLDLFVDGNVILNRDTGTAEGSLGSASVARPLYSAQTAWAWSTGVTWKDDVNRRYVNAAVDTFTATPRASASPVLWEWRERTIAEQARLTRSFGWETKNDVSLGASMTHATYRVPAEASRDAGAIEDFERAAVPVGEDRVGPFAQWHGYSSDFQRVLDQDTLGLQEDNRLGHDLWVRAYPVLRGLGSTRDFLGVYAAAAYSVALGDGLARASLESTVEEEPDRIADASLVGALALVTPRLVAGRLFYSAMALNRWRNHLNALSFLGGDSLLRGYPSRYLVGKDLVATNLEYRSRPIEVVSVQLGAVAFYDVGDAFDGFDHVQPKHAVGVGLRAVFPQIERAALRFDVGFPISASPLPAGVAPVSFFFAFHQALSLPAPGQGLGP
jgi:hypothetical protein